jgi:hypothetical protein
MRPLTVTEAPATGRMVMVPVSVRLLIVCEG